MTMRRTLSAAVLVANTIGVAAQTAPPIPFEPLVFGGFNASFGADPSTSLRRGTFTLQGDGWPPFKGTWRIDAGVIELVVPGMRNCEGPGRYRVQGDEHHVSFDLVSDACEPRKMILDRSLWRPASEARIIPARQIERTVADRTPLRAAIGRGAGNWPSFRGPSASGRQPYPADPGCSARTLPSAAGPRPRAGP